MILERGTWLQSGAKNLKVAKQVAHTRKKPAEALKEDGMLVKAVDTCMISDNKLRPNISALRV